MKKSLSFAPIGAVRVARCVDAEPLFAKLAGKLRENGYRLAGVQQVNVARPGRCRCDMILRDLATGAELCISEDRGKEARGCRLDHGALDQAALNISQAIDHGADLVIINKFGKAESEGGGMRPVIARALDAEVPVLICANQEHHANLLAFAGGLAVALQPSEAMIGDWLGDVMSSTPGLCVETRS